MDKCLVVNYVPSNEQVANILNKPLSAISFHKLRKKLTVESPAGFQGECQSTQ